MATACLATAAALGVVIVALAALVIGVFVGLEAAGILLGYALFRKPLSLIRAAAD